MAGRVFCESVATVGDLCLILTGRIMDGEVSEGMQIQLPGPINGKTTLAITGVEFHPVDRARVGLSVHVGTADELDRLTKLQLSPRELEILESDAAYGENEGN